MKQPLTTITERVAAVRAHADKHYSHGWDEIAECWSDGDIIEAIKGSKTNHGAICKLSPGIKARHAYAQDIRGA